MMFSASPAPRPGLAQLVREGVEAQAAGFVEYNDICFTSAFTGIGHKRLCILGLHGKQESTHACAHHAQEELPKARGALA